MNSDRSELLAHTQLHHKFAPRRNLCICGAIHIANITQARSHVASCRYAKAAGLDWEEAKRRIVAGETFEGTRKLKRKSTVCSASSQVSNMEAIRFADRSSPANSQDTDVDLLPTPKRARVVRLLDPSDPKSKDGTSPAPSRPWSPLPDSLKFRAINSEHPGLAPPPPCPYTSYYILTSMRMALSRSSIVPTANAYSRQKKSTAYPARPPFRGPGDSSGRFLLEGNAEQHPPDEGG